MREGEVGGDGEEDGDAGGKKVVDCLGSFGPAGQVF